MTNERYLGLKLHDVVNMGDADAAIKCLADGADVNYKDAVGSTPLIAAAYTGQASMVKLLLSHGADPSVTDMTGSTAYQLAIEVGHSDVIEALSNDELE